MTPHLSKMASSIPGDRDNHPGPILGWKLSPAKVLTEAQGMQGKGLASSQGFFNTDHIGGEIMVEKGWFYLKVRVPVALPDISSLGLGTPALMLMAVGTEFSWPAGVLVGTRAQEAQAEPPFCRQISLGPHLQALPAPN